jgi:DNA-binding NtrC family response regulator
MDLSGIRKLLIVDDEIEIRSSLEALVQPLGLQTVLAKDGLEALNLVKSIEFHAIVCDITMPQMTGTQFLVELKRLTLDIPVVMLTGCDDKENIKTALKLGAFDFISKPFDFDNVLNAITKALEVGVRKKRIDQKIKSQIPEAQVEKLSADIAHEKQMISLIQLVNHSKNKN